MARAATMSDIARRAGVSRVAVSYALNGRPGVSDEVRERILQIAGELGFSANAAAKALHGAAAHAVGLTLRRPSPALTAEVFRRELISGLQSTLSARGFGLALQFVADADEELAVYERWSAERRVDGVIVCDLTVDDPRLTTLPALGLPVVVVGTSVHLPHVAFDDTAAAVLLAGHLAGRGHRRVVRVSGPTGLLHTARRAAAFSSACAAAGIEDSIVVADSTGEQGAQVTRRLLSGPGRPTAIVYDNDLMAVAGLAVTREMGVAVPRDVSLVAWEDSALCQVVRPPLTVLKRDITGLGAQAAALLLALLDGAAPADVHLGPPELIVRDST